MAKVIQLDAPGLLAESSRLEGLARDLQRALNQAEHSTFRHGLPGYAKQSQVAIADMRVYVDMLRLHAGALRARYVLALMAALPGGRMLGARVKAFERRDPGGLLKMLVEANISASAGPSADATMRQLAVDVERRLKTKLAMSDKDWVLARAQMKKLNVEAYRRRFGLYAFEMHDKLKPLRIHAAVDAWVNPKGKLGKLGVGPVGPLVDAMLQWNNDRGDRMGAGTRAGRVGVNVGAGIVAGGLTALACVGTGGLACPLAVGTALGFAGSMGADKLNQELLPSDAQKRERASREAAERLARQLRKADQWYIENGRPSKTWLDQRLQGAQVSHVSSRGVTVTTYHQPFSGVKIAERTTLANGNVTMRHYDNHGNEIKPR